MLSSCKEGYFVVENLCEMIESKISGKQIQLPQWFQRDNKDTIII